MVVIRPFLLIGAISPIGLTVFILILFFFSEKMNGIRHGDLVGIVHLYADKLF